jgi:ABC-type Fe3+/spermidine/putrescine transport system ATPase subunit
MFQNYALFPHMTVANNIAYGLRRPVCTRAEIESRV